MAAGHGQQEPRKRNDQETKKMDRTPNYFGR